MGDKCGVKIRSASMRVSTPPSYFHGVRSVLLFCRKGAISRAVSPSFLVPFLFCKRKKGDGETHPRRRGRVKERESERDSEAEDIRGVKIHNDTRRRSAMKRCGTAPQKTLTHWCNKEQRGVWWKVKKIFLSLTWIKSCVHGGQHGKKYRISLKKCA